MGRRGRRKIRESEDLPEKVPHPWLGRNITFRVKQGYPGSIIFLIDPGFFRFTGFLLTVSIAVLKCLKEGAV